MTIEELLETYNGKRPATFAADHLHLLDHTVKRQLAAMMLTKILEAGYEDR